MVVVLNSPGVEGVDERHEHERAHNVFHKLVLAEAAVAAVMSHHKQLQGTVTRPGQARSIFVISIIVNSKTFKTEQQIMKHKPLTQGIELFEEADEE